ncbi:MAG: thioredoxin domain-containing protein, partial [Flavobacteriales bacterium]
MEKYTNALIHESSPYLLQHAHNPVNWVPWSETVFEQAQREDKLVLISIGYSACHWCHVMEHECFEDTEVAALMNKFFINVKVDREERPDVDQVYMTAVQLMTQRGGWPLNCFTLPDGRPVYGGTYFPKEQWMHILRSLEHTYRNDRARAVDYADNLHEGI